MTNTTKLGDWLSRISDKLGGVFSDATRKSGFDPAKRGTLAQLGAVAVAGSASTLFATEAQAGSIGTFHIPGVGSFPEYLTDSSVEGDVGEKVEGGTLRQQQNFALLGNVVTSETPNYTVPSGNRNLTVNIKPVANSSYAKAFEVNVDRRDYIVVQNNNVPGPDGSKNQCDMVFFPICDHRALPDSDTIDADQRAFEVVAQHLTGERRMQVVSFEATDAELQQGECVVSPRNPSNNNNNDYTAATAAPGSGGTTLEY